MTDEEAQDLSKEDKAELMKQGGKSRSKDKRQTMIDLSEKLGLSGEGREQQDIEYEVDERYDEGGVEDAPKPKFDYKKFFRNRRADGGAIRKNFSNGGDSDKNTREFQNKYIQAAIKLASDKNIGIGDAMMITSDEDFDIDNMEYKGSSKGILEILNQKADGGAIGIEVLFEEKKPRKDFNIGGNVQRVTTPQPYDARASATDFARAIDTVGAGTNMQKAKAIQSYDQNVQRQNMVNRIQKMNPAGTGNFLQGIKDFGQHAMVSEAMAGKTGKSVIPQYGFQTGYDFQKKFTGLDPKISSGLAAAYQTLQEGSRALLDGPGGITLGQAMKTAQEQATENMEGILAADTGTITPEQQAARNEYLESQGQPTDASVAGPSRETIIQRILKEIEPGFENENSIARAFADQYETGLNLDYLKTLDPDEIKLRLDNAYLQGKGFENPDFSRGRIGGGRPFFRYGPEYMKDFNMAGGPLQLSDQYTGYNLRNELGQLESILGRETIKPYKTKVEDALIDLYRNRYSGASDLQKRIFGLKDGGRVGLFMGGPALEGQALNIYNSMNSYGFTDQQIADALSAQGLYTPSGSSTPETTAPNIINQQLQTGGGGDNNFGGQGIGAFGNLDPNTKQTMQVEVADGKGGVEIKEVDTYLDAGGMRKTLDNKNPVNAGIDVKPLAVGIFESLFGKKTDDEFDPAGKIYGTFNNPNYKDLSFFGKIKADYSRQKELKQLQKEFELQEKLKAQIAEEQKQAAFNQAMSQGRSFYDQFGKGDAASTASREEAGSGFSDVSESGPFKDGGLATMFVEKR